ncbi:phage protease [Undibacterium sp. FT147W]|uniref:Phage protease n=1 Tax=Undibacterium rivi TaxID=2828729 RepID=A0ABS5H5F3_9BURK|nr:phage protease [Undibacterium rivi]MBR7793787.1 phage protease [Undibacterium rivi]
MPNPSTHIAIAALSFELSTDSSAGLQLTPSGAFRARDGRPTDVAAWFINADVAARVIQLASSAANSLVIDYEHQTLNAEANGQPAPAAGWFKNMEWREGVGLFAINVEWTEKAKAFIAAKEYKYISPVFSYSKTTGEVIKMLHVALTNTPALDGMQAVALKNLETSLQLPNEETMNPVLKALLAKLGLPETTSETDAMTAVTALKAKADQIDAKDAEIVGLKAKADQLTAKDAEIVSLKAANATNAGNPDPAKFVPIEAMTAMQSQIAALTAKFQNGEVNDVVTVALKEGRLLPAQESWARELGNKDLASLKAFVASAPAIAALKQTQTQGKAPVSDPDAELSDEQIAICKSLGLSKEDYKKSLAE